MQRNRKGTLHYAQNISTKEKASREGAWLSEKDVLKKRTKDPCPPSSERAREIIGLR